MAPPSRETVEIPRSWLVLLAGGLILALLLVAYLMGREAGRGSARVVEPSPAVVAPEPDDPDDYEADLGDPYDDERPPVETQPAPADDAWPPEASPAQAAPPAPGPGPEAAAVAAYFTELEGLERGAKYWNNPQDLAMRLVGQGAQGDTSGFRQLVETQRTARRQIEAMTVPGPCLEHHRLTLDVMGQALELLEKLERGVSTGNLDGLLSLADDSRALEADARTIDVMATELKRQYGVQDGGVPPPSS
jgi:hypothetical protein